MSNFSELPDWMQQELVIIRVGIALGGDLAAAVFRDYVRSCQPEGKTVSVDRLAAVLDSCLELERNPGHKAVAQQVLTWAERMARGSPVDYRVPSLVVEWCPPSDRALPTRLRSKRGHLFKKGCGPIGVFHACPNLPKRARLKKTNVLRTPNQIWSRT